MRKRAADGAASNWLSSHVNHSQASRVLHVELQYFESGCGDTNASSVSCQNRSNGKREENDVWTPPPEVNEPPP
jgi:hypothetical protein